MRERVGILKLIGDKGSFIGDMKLVDMPVSGGKLTWHKRDGSATSRVDIFLISEFLVSAWTLGCMNISDHNHIRLKGNVKKIWTKAIKILQLLDGS